MLLTCFCSTTMVLMKEADVHITTEIVPTSICRVIVAVTESYKTKEEQNLSVFILGTHERECQFLYISVKSETLFSSPLANDMLPTFAISVSSKCRHGTKMETSIYSETKTL